MADFIKTCTSLYPEIRVMVLTGGEVLSLDIEMVKRILRLAKSCGLTTRIVTNAFWATTISAASLLMDELVHENFIDFSKLPKITAEVRENLLDWVTRCIQVENGKIQTETGRKVRLIWDKTSTERIKIECEDGILMMPPVKLEVRKITEVFSDQEDSEVAK